MMSETTNSTAVWAIRRNWP